MVRGLSGVPDEHYLWDFGWGLQGYGHRVHVSWRREAHAQ